MSGKKAKQLRKLAVQNVRFSYDAWKEIYAQMKQHGDQLIIDLSLDRNAEIQKQILDTIVNGNK